ncbi:MAG: DUF1048 domain-containing protein [Culicoidibacterales bacterium]
MMNIQTIIEGKKAWRVHVKRVKQLPVEYQIVYNEIQKYIFKVGIKRESEMIEVLIGIIELFEDGVSRNQHVLEITGADVANFCDEIIVNYEKNEDVVE